MLIGTASPALSAGCSERQIVTLNDEMVGMKLPADVFISI